MKAFTVRQPWAYLIIKGSKSIETKNMRPPAKLIGKEVLLHVGLTPDIYLKGDCGDSFVDSSFGRLPLGVLVGIVRIVGLKDYRGKGGLPSRKKFIADDSHHLCGFPGQKSTKWGWELEVVREFDKPIPFRGMPGFFEVETCGVCEGNYQDRKVTVYKCHKCGIEQLKPIGCVRIPNSNYPECFEVQFERLQDCPYCNQGITIKGDKK